MTGSSLVGITLDSTELRRATHSFTSDWRSNLLSWVLDFTHLWSWKGIGTPEFNDFDGWVGEYFWQYTVVICWCWHYQISPSHPVLILILLTMVQWLCEKNKCSGADLRHLSWYWLIVNRNLELNKWLALFALCFLCVAFTVWHTVHCQLSGQYFLSFAHCVVRPAEIWPLPSLCWKSQLQTACVKQMCTSDLTYDPSCFTKSSNWGIDDSYVGEIV